MYDDPYNTLTLISRIISTVLLIISIILLIYHLCRLYRIASDGSKPVKVKKCDKSNDPKGGIKKKGSIPITPKSGTASRSTSNENTAYTPSSQPGTPTKDEAAGTTISPKSNNSSSSKLSDPPRSTSSMSSLSLQTITDSHSSSVNKIASKTNKGWTLCAMIQDLFDNTSNFRAVLKQQSVKYTIYLCLSTIALCARSVFWAFYPVTYDDGIGYLIIFTLYILPKGLHRWMMYWLLLSKVHIIFQRTKYRIGDKPLKRYQAVITILHILALSALLLPVWLNGSRFYVGKVRRFLVFFGWFILIELLPSIFCCYIFVKRIYLHLSGESYECPERSTSPTLKSFDNNPKNIALTPNLFSMNQEMKTAESTCSDVSDVASLIPKTLLLTLCIIIFAIGFTVIGILIQDIRIVNLILDPIQGIGITACILLMYKSHLMVYTKLCLCIHKRIKAI